MTVRVKTIKVKSLAGYLSLPEVAALKGVTRQAVWQAVVAGRLHAEKVGRDHLVHRDDAENWKPRVAADAEN